MFNVLKSPIVKRLNRGFRRRYAKLTSVEGFKVKKYNVLLWLICYRNYVDRQIGFMGGFEKDQIRYLLTSMTKGCDVFLDVGANFGLYALQIAKSGLAHEVHAFEPDARNAAQLAGSLYLDKLTSKVRVHPVAVSDTAGYIPSELHPETSTGTTRVASTGGNTVLEAVSLEHFRINPARTLSW
jgi:hypothetical protein